MAPVWRKEKRAPHMGRGLFSFLLGTGQEERYRGVPSMRCGHAFHCGVGLAEYWGLALFVSPNGNCMCGWLN